MKLIIKNEIFDKFPDLNIVAIRAKNIENKGIDEEILKLMKEREKEIRETLDSETLSQNPFIRAWREAYSSFGAKPKDYKCSVENLLRIILKGISIRHINKIVDIYNYISIKHIVPAGGDDTDKVEGDVILKSAVGNEKFVELGSQQLKNPREGEVVYSDDKEILCRRWNWRECDKTKMTEDTKNVLLVIEGLPPATKEKIEDAAKELILLIQKFCGGEASYYLLNKDNNKIDID